MGQAGKVTYAKPKVSVMIPTYNQAHLVGKAIESALAQTYENLEVIVADDASPDETPEVVGGFTNDPRVNYYRNSTNLGRVANYQRTLYERATGDWVISLDGDDYFTDPKYVDTAIQCINNNDDIILVFGGIRRIIEPDGVYLTQLPTKHRLERVDGTSVFLAWFTDFPVAHMATLYRRDLAMSIGFYEKNILSSDWESLRRLVLHGDVLLLGRVAGVWQGHGGNASCSLVLSEHISNLESILRPYAYALERGLPEARLVQWKDRALADYVAIFAGSFLAIGDRVSAHALLEALRDHSVAYRLALRYLFLNPKLWAKIGLHLLGGDRLVVRATTLWRWLTWS